MSVLDVRLESILSPMTVAAQTDDTLVAVAARMRRNDVGSIVVVRDTEEIVGILTERDLVRAVADGTDLTDTVVADYMTVEMTTATPNTDVIEAARTMVRLGIRHLPVVVDGHPVGVVSLRDILIELIP